MREMKDIHWLAGFLEGEGTFCMSNGKRDLGYKQFIIRVGSTDKDVIKRASKLLKDGSICGDTYRTEKYGYKQLYNFSISGKAAISWMMTLYSLMGERRKARIKECILAWRSHSSKYQKALRVA